MKKMNIVFAVVIILICSPSYAALIVSWEYNNPNPIVGPTDTIELFGTIYNNATSNSRLVCCSQSVGGDIGGVISSTGYSWGSLIFHETFAPSNPYDAQDSLVLDGLDLAPGESSGFIFLTLLPHAGSVPDGVYTFMPLITIRTSENPVESISIGPNSPLYVTVTSVPIPGAIYLFLGGLACLTGASHRARKIG